jgi:hypothetical protein
VLAGAVNDELFGRHQASVDPDPDERMFDR